MVASMLFEVVLTASISISIQGPSQLFFDENYVSVQSITENSNLILLRKHHKYVGPPQNCNSMTEKVSGVGIHYLSHVMSVVQLQFICLLIAN